MEADGPAWRLVKTLREAAGPADDLPARKMPANCHESFNIYRQGSIKEGDYCRAPSQLVHCSKLNSHF